jgi:hypothetical protein
MGRELTGPAAPRGWQQLGMETSEVAKYKKGNFECQVPASRRIGKGHRYPLGELKCISPKRRRELGLCLGFGVCRPAGVRI